MNFTKQNNPHFSEPETELSLVDIIIFLKQSWKKLAIASVVGAGLGFGGWLFFGSYSAEYILLNNPNINTANTYALDLVSWKTLQKSLPNLAAQADSEGKAPYEQRILYEALSKEVWWQKNVVPTYALSKSDIKDLAGISKDLDAASTTILSLTLTGSGASKEKSLENVKGAANFLRTGSAYLQIRNILNGYEGESISSVAEIQKKITSTEIEMGYQRARAKFLEDLYRRYPNNTNLGQQPFDSKETGAKYLSITAQIIAINNDINQSKENLQRLRDRLSQIALIKIFLDQAIPLAENSLDGLVLGAELLRIESALRVNLDKNDIQGQETLDQLRSQLLQVQARFTKGLEANTAPTSNGKKGAIKSTIGGLVSLFFIMLLVLLGQKVIINIKGDERNEGPIKKVGSNHDELR